MAVSVSKPIHATAARSFGSAAKSKDMLCFPSHGWPIKMRNPGSFRVRTRERGNKGRGIQVLFLGRKRSKNNLAPRRWRGEGTAVSRKG